MSGELAIVRKLYRFDVSHGELLMPDRHCLELPAYSLRSGAAWDTNNVRLGTQSKSARVVPSWPYYLLCCEYMCLTRGG
jgi:hypothetical protein